MTTIKALLIFNTWCLNQKFSCFFYLLRVKVLRSVNLFSIKTNIASLTFGSFSLASCLVGRPPVVSTQKTHKSRF